MVRRHISKVVFRLSFLSKQIQEVFNKPTVVLVFTVVIGGVTGCCKTSMSETFNDTEQTKHKLLNPLPKAIKNLSAPTQQIAVLFRAVR